MYYFKTVLSAKMNCVIKKFQLRWDFSITANISHQILSKPKYLRHKIHSNFLTELYWTGCMSIIDSCVCVFKFLLHCQKKKKCLLLGQLMYCIFVYIVPYSSIKYYYVPQWKFKGAHMVQSRHFKDTATVTSCCTPKYTHFAHFVQEMLVEKELTRRCNIT